MTETLAIDWPKVFDELAYLLGDVVEPDTGRREPVSVSALADALKVPRGTLRYWIDGSEPRHVDGEGVLMVWCRLTGKGRDFAPRTRRPLSAHVR